MERRKIISCKKGSKMQFNFEKVTNLLGKVVYLNGATLPNLEPFVVCGYCSRDNFLQMHSLVTGKFISGVHPDQVSVAVIRQEDL